uniref:FAD:protein FMN transferase n=1 Tax=Nocardioides sp. TaxID=35761 RepID=UPI00286B242E
MSHSVAGEVAARFPALGTEVFVAVRRPAELIDARHLAETVLSDVDEVCSRFRDDSDLCRANRHPGRWVEVDPLLVEAVRVARDAASLTDGLVNPLLGRTLVQLGYDRDFRLLAQLDESHDVAGEPPSPDAWKLIGLGVDTLCVPHGTELDLGATGKAWSADLIASAWEDAGLGPAVVSVGGDVRVAAPDDTPWTVDVCEHPGAPADATITLSHGGLATSSTQVRRWT